MRERLERAQANRRTVVAENAQQILDAIDQFEEDDWAGLGQFLESYTGLLGSARWARVNRAIGQKLMDAGIPEEVRGERYSVNEMAFITVLAAANLKESATVMNYGPTFLERWPGSTLGDVVEGQVQMMITREERRASGRETAEQAILESELDALDSIAAQARGFAGVDAAADAWLEVLAFRVERGMGDDLESLDDAFDALTTAGRWEEAAALMDRGLAIDAYAREPESWQRTLDSHERQQETIAREREDAAADDAEVRDVLNLVRALDRDNDRRGALEALAALEPQLADMEDREVNDYFQKRINLLTQLGEYEAAAEAISEWEPLAAEREDVEVATGLVRQVRSAGDHAGFRDEQMMYHHLRAATTWQTNHQWEECIPAAERFLEFEGVEDTLRITVMSSLATCHAELGQFADAHAVYDRLFDEYPTNPTAAAWRAVVDNMPAE